MTTLAFLLTIAALFGAVLAYESHRAGEAALGRPLGLIGWLTGGNWPAKIGAGLVIVGVGSLLRYALINFDVAPALKLASGAVAAGLLGLAATLTRIGHGRRAVSLALGGAAFGVAYLTAYSAFALFEYLASSTGVTLLLLTAIGAGVYAVTRRALSLALLAMLGAYLAPAFSIDDPGPTIVYGYYVGASLMTLAMVALRGWRPLIHLSFLFTLLGGAFFAWTARYYEPGNADVMLPALLLLVAIHVAMPLIEHKLSGERWLERLDIAYALALPIVAALSAWLLAPSRVALSNELAVFAVIWLATALWLRISARDGIALHAVIGVLMAGLAVAARFANLPWELVTLATTVIALWLAARRPEAERLQSILAGFVPIAGAAHVIDSLGPNPDGALFFNAQFIERLIGAGLLMFAGHICARIRQSLDSLLWSVGIGWALIAVGSELLRADLLDVALLVHWSLLVVALVLAAIARVPDSVLAARPAVPIAVLVTAVWAASASPGIVAWVSLCAAPVALICLAIGLRQREHSSDSASLLSGILAPVVAAVWAIPVGETQDVTTPQFALSIAALVALSVLLLAGAALRRTRDWLGAVSEVYAGAFLLALFGSTTFWISRSPWAVALECLSLAGLLWLLRAQSRVAPLPRWVGPLTAIAAVLFSQAQLLRWLGPAGPLSMFSILDMRLPALLSLFWAGTGAALTIFAKSRASRALWIAGSVFLVASTVKIILFDFGSLGQLGNIFAVIAAGLVFLLVGWLAPMPPDAPDVAPATPPRTQPGPSASPSDEPSPSMRPLIEARNEYIEMNARRAQPAEPPADVEAEIDVEADDRGKKTAWTIAIVLGLILPLTRCAGTPNELLRQFLGKQHDSPSTYSAGIADPSLSPASSPSSRAAIAEEVELDVADVLPAAASEPSAEPPVAAEDSVEQDCRRWASLIPRDAVVYAGGAYRGKPLDFPINESNREAGQLEAVVHVPDRSVVLLLGAYEETLWTVRWSARTRIVGIWVSGYHTQALNGVPPDVPVLVNDVTSRTPDCPSFYVASHDNGGARNAAVELLGRSPVSVIEATRDGRVNVGNVLETSAYLEGPVRRPETFRVGELPLIGEKGIEELLRTGKLRRATTLDIQTARAFATQYRNATDRELKDVGAVPQRTFVVVGLMHFPGGLYGARAVNFIVPRGVKTPQGDPGHSPVFDMNL